MFRDAAYWAAIHALVDTAPPMTEQQAALLRQLLFTPVTTQKADDNGLRPATDRDSAALDA